MSVSHMRINSILSMMGFVKDHRLLICFIVYNFETPASLSTGSRSGGPAPPGAGLLDVQSGHCDGLLSITL